MRVPTTTRRPPFTRRLVAIATVVLVSLTGPTFLPGAADAAPPTLQRCDDKFGLRGRTAADPSTLPWANGQEIRPEADWDSYDYPNERMAFSGLTLPDDPVEQEKFLAKLDKPYTKYKEGTPERVYARYKDYLTRQGGTDTKYGGFDKWLREAYIEVYGYNRRGAAFHAKVVKDLGMVGPDWFCEVTLDVTDPDTGKTYQRRFDAVHRKTVNGQQIFDEVHEFKSGGNHDTTQAPKDRAFLKDPRYAKSRIVYTFGDTQAEKTTEYTRNLKTNNPGRVSTYEHISTGRPTFTPTKYTAQDTPKSIGRSSEVIRQSPFTPNDMKALAERNRLGDPTGMRVRGPGGVDFSTLELRYIGAPVKGQGLNYSFAAKKVDESAGLGYGGQQKAELISDSFFTWLALTPDKFWVNLNPWQPDTIMDPTFGKTDAGRVLLQADLEMKHDFAKNLDYRVGLGKKLREAMDEKNIPCGHATRNWIVPEPAVVRQQDGGIYILDSPLKVNSVALEVPPGVDLGCNLTKAQDEQYQELFDTMIRPVVEDEVNTDPRYADLRRVYNSRVAAEFIRQQDAEHPTDYHSIINSNKVADWPLRGENRSWTPEQTYKDFLKSWTEGDYTIPCSKNGENAMCVMGGVDFSKAPKTNLSKARFEAEHKHLTRTTEISVRAMTNDAENLDLLALGGNTASHRGTSGGSKVTPSPEPSPTPTKTPPVAAEPPVDVDDPGFTG